MNEKDTEMMRRLQGGGTDISFVHTDPCWAAEMGMTAHSRRYMREMGCMNDHVCPCECEEDE